MGTPIASVGKGTWESCNKKKYAKRFKEYGQHTFTLNSEKVRIPFMDTATPNVRTKKIHLNFA